MAIWLMYRAHRHQARLVETLIVLSEPENITDVILHPFIRDYSWERIGDRAYHAYDDQWEYKLERWEIDDSLVRTNWVSTSGSTGTPSSN